MLNEAHVARPKAPDSNQSNMFWHHTPSKHRAGPRIAKHHHNVTHSTRFRPHARRHPTPPHLACFIIVPAINHPQASPSYKATSQHSILNKAHVARPKAHPTRPHRASFATAPPPSTTLVRRPPPQRPKHMPMCGA